MAYLFEDDKSKVNLSDALSADQDAIATIMNALYPVGTIYMSVNSANPGDIFGGTWQAWGAGRVPVGVNTSDTSFDTVEKTGGEKTHKLTANESGTTAHVHGGFRDIDYYVMNDSPSARNVGITDGTEGNIYYIDGQSQPEIKFKHRTTTGAAEAKAAVSAHNNLQPYITCYMWKRIA